MSWNFHQPNKLIKLFRSILWKTENCGLWDGGLANTYLHGTWTCMVRSCSLTNVCRNSREAYTVPRLIRMDHVKR